MPSFSPHLPCHFSVIAQRYPAEVAGALSVLLEVYDSELSLEGNLDFVLSYLDV